MAAVAALVLVPLAVAGGAALHLTGNMGRVPAVFDGLDARPAVAPEAGGATNILLVVTDGGPVPQEEPAELTAQAARSDAIMVLHLDSARQAAWVVAIPPDTVLEVPGHGQERLATTFSIGGPGLTVETVEEFTGVRVDHLAVIDWAGFGALVDAVGGVEIDVPVGDPAEARTERRYFTGPRAVAYAESRDDEPGDVLARVGRQQAVLNAVMQSVLHQEMRKQPHTLYRFLDTVTRHLAVDDQWSVWDMGRLVLSMRDFRSANIAYLTIPVADVTEQGGSVAVRPDLPANRELWQAVADDRMAAWTAAHPDAVTPPPGG
jgi:LCP family protein required for cell wall assembly